MNSVTNKITQLFVISVTVDYHGSKPLNILLSSSKIAHKNLNAVFTWLAVYVITKLASMNYGKCIYLYCT